MPRINGIKGAYPQPLRYGKDQNGSYTLVPYEGTKAEVLSLISSIELLKGTWEFEDSYSGAKCKINARFPVNTVSGQQEQPIDQWEFFAAKVEKDLLETDNAAINAISSADKREIRRSIAASDSPTAFGSQAAVDVYNLMLDGVRARIQFAPSLKHTQTVSQNWTVKASLTNVGRIISTASITTLEAIPSAILFNLPSDTTTKSGVSYGWFKMHPTVRVAANQKISIEQEWIYGLWSTTLYGSVI